MNRISVVIHALCIIYTWLWSLLIPSSVVTGCSKVEAVIWRKKRSSANHTLQWRREVFLVCWRLTGNDQQLWSLLGTHCRRSFVPTGEAVNTKTITRLLLAAIRQHPIQFLTQQTRTTITAKLSLQLTYFTLEISLFEYNTRDWRTEEWMFSRST